MVPCPRSYDLIVVGAGHAGCEAALALARMGHRTLLLTLNLDGVAHYGLLPDFLHPHRHYVLGLLQHVVDLYLPVGLGWQRLMDRLSELARGSAAETGPAASTVREWVSSFVYGAGHLLFDHLLRHLLPLDPTVFDRKASEKILVSERTNGANDPMVFR